MSYCINLGFTKIGDNCDNPGSRKVEINYTTVSENVTNSIMESDIFTENTTVINQEQNVKIDGNCCNTIDISQSGVVKVIDTTKINIEMSFNVGNSIKNEVGKQLKNNQSKINSFLGNKRGEELTTLLNNSISKIIKTDTFKSSVVKSLNSTITNQNQNVNIICSEEIPMPNSKGGVCKISQSFLIESSVNNTIETIMSDLISDPDINEFINKIDTETKIKLPEIRTKYWYEENYEYLKLILIIFIVPLLIRLIYNVLKGLFRKR